MLWNYLKIALRNIKKHKVFSIVNITGLAVGMACCILILLWVKDEMSYDRFHRDSNSLYRTVMNVEGDWWTATPWAVAPILKRDYPEIAQAARYASRTRLVSEGERSFYETVAFVDDD